MCSSDLKKNIINLILIFVLGGLGGVLFSNVLLPKISNLTGVDWGAGEKTIIVNKTEEIKIEESEILKDAILKNRESLVVIKVFKNKKFLSEGVGFIVSSDGLILTRREVVVSSGDEITIERKGEIFSAKIYKRLDDRGLILLKSDASNFPVVSFGNVSEIPLGSKVILIGNKNGSLGNIDFVNVGVLKSVDDSIIETSIIEDINLTSGTPLLDVRGNVLGINFTNSKGYVFSVSSDVIQAFIY